VVFQALARRLIVQIRNLLIFNENNSARFLGPHIEPAFYQDIGQLAGLFSTKLSTASVDNFKTPLQGYKFIAPSLKSL
jgi:hypothetical protein